MTDIKDILKARGSRYGKFLDHAIVTQELKAVIFENGIGQKLQADQQECLEMICHKLGRIICGDPHYEDSWRDIAGYATLVADRLIEDEQQAELENVSEECLDTVIEKKPTIPLTEEELKNHPLSYMDAAAVEKVIVTMDELMKSGFVYDEILSPAVSEGLTRIDYSSSDATSYHLPLKG